MYDIKVVNGTILSGDGSLERAGECGVRDGRITKVSPTVSGAAQTVLDAKGHIVCPGFIDLHTHCEAGINENYLQSGVTLAVSGNCGFSEPDLAHVAAGIAGATGFNLALLIGHNTVRMHVMGNVDREPAAAEMQAMQCIVEKAMQDGAVGFSTGLTYVPGNYATTDEIVKLAVKAAAYGGYYTSHMRDEGDGLMDSIRESAEIGKSSGLPVHLSHLKVRGSKHWGRAGEALDLLDEYRAQGLDITQDQYPYTASCGRIYLLFPAWAQEGGRDEMLARLAAPQSRKRLKQEVTQHLDDFYDGDGDRIVISGAPDPNLVGLSLADHARNAGRANQAGDLAETVLEIATCFPEQTQVYCVFHAMCEDDLALIMQHPQTCIASDAWSPKPTELRPHPRMFGTFPRALGHYAREKQLLSIPTAVHRMTGLPARRLGLTDRGLLQEGAWADITVFDPETVIDRATYEKPKQYPSGIDYVLVNGQIVMVNGSHTGALPGTFVARSSISK